MIEKVLEAKDTSEVPEKVGEGGRGDKSKCGATSSRKPLWKPMYVRNAQKNGENV